MNFSGCVVCVLGDGGLAAPLNAWFAAQGSAALMPLAADVSPVDRLYQGLDMVSAARDLVLLPGWGDCAVGRALWNAAQALAMPIVYVEPAPDGGFVFGMGNAILAQIPAPVSRGVAR